MKNSSIIMADGSHKPIEAVEVGDEVRGRHGESNLVLALHRSTLNGRALYKINGTHVVTHDQIHWTIRGPSSFMPASVEPLKGREFPVQLADGSTAMRKYVGFINPVEKIVRTDLLVSADGLRAMDSVEMIYSDPTLPCFDLVLGGSHTYFMNGYLLAGWPREDDFDYFAWQPRKAADAVFLPFGPVAA